VENGTNTPQDSKAPSPVNAGAYEDQPVGNPPLLKTSNDSAIESIRNKALSLRIHQLEQKDILRDHQNASRLKNEIAISESLKTLENMGSEILEYLKKQEEYRNTKELERVYSFRHEKYNWLKIGHSADFDKRRKSHERDGWEYLGDEAGTLRGSERPLKDQLREAGFKSIPHSDEIFEIDEPLINFLIKRNWVGITKDLIKKDSQTSLALDSTQSST
tara:strand:+ start:141 stop:794 length:654 start_codon:yes stop_codon:yes gene_type:complete